MFRSANRPNRCAARTQTAGARPRRVATSDRRGGPGTTALVQRKCAACEEQDEASVVQRSAEWPQAGTSQPAPEAVTAELRAPGRPLDARVRSAFQRRTGWDLSQVRIHTGAQAGASARAIGARAYTSGWHVVFADEAYTPETRSGRALLAHELTHVVQQTRGSAGGAGPLRIGASDTVAEREADAVAQRVTAGELPGATPGSAPRGTLQRACLSAATCAGPIAGSASEFGAREESFEARARARRARMSPARARANGHTGRARQLERFLDAHAPGLRVNIHGIFLDFDLSPDTGALTMACDQMTPPIQGATKPCVFVHGAFNQEASAFMNTTRPTIGGVSREDWRVATLQTLTHEIQHVIFDNAVRPAPPGAGGCSRATVAHELSEMNAIISEFPTVFRAIPAGAAAGSTAQTRLDRWFQSVITNPSESIQGILKTMRCACDCSEVDAWVIDTFNFVASSWTAAERTAFNTELRRAVWGLGWPL